MHLKLGFQMKKQLIKQSGQHRRNFQQGFSLVEVLVSLLLMTIGLLGISGLMVSGINNTSGFDLASRASQSASAIMDGMRANSTNAKNYITSWGVAPSTLTGTIPSDTDRKTWLTAVQLLPGGDASIAYADSAAACAIANLSACEYLVSIRFANCLGSLSATELANCKNAVSNNEKRTISFRFRV